MKLVFSDEAWEDYLYWVEVDAKAHERLNDLIDECRRTPFKGIGKPEPLKGDLQGWWSQGMRAAFGCFSHLPKRISS